MDKVRIKELKIQDLFDPLYDEDKKERNKRRKNKNEEKDYE
jgi:hypothetical protein